MFDFRYHALSLAAVLLALVIGLLLGVAIGDAGLVSSAEKNLRNSLRSSLNRTRAQLSQVQDQNSFRNQFETSIYPDLVARRLNGKHVGLIFLGQPDDGVNGLVRSALDPTGAQLVLVAVIREPPDLASLGAQAAPGRYAALATDPSLLRPFGVRMGIQLTRGGTLIQRERGGLLSTFNGTLEPLDAVIVMRNGATLSAPDAHNVDTFESGLLAGLTSNGKVPVAGVETTTTNPSHVPWYQQQNIASVDDLDDLAGRTALIFELGGAKGTYGIKSTAQGLLPNILGGP